MTIQDELSGRGGVARSCLELYRELSTLGVEVAVLYGTTGSRATEWSDFASGSHDLGGSPLLPRSRPHESVQRVWAATRFARKLGATVVSVQAPRQYELGFVLSRLLRVPLMVQLRTDPGNPGPRFRYILQRADSLVAVSDHIASTWSNALSIEPDRIRVIHTGVDQAAIGRAVEGRKRTRALLGIAASERLVSVVARIDPEKGILEAMAAFAAVRDHVDGLRMVVAGGASSSTTGTDYLGKVERLAVAEGIRLLGHVEDPLPIIAASDLVVHATHRDALPRTVLEAISAGVPVLATNIGGVPEILGPQLTDYLVGTSTEELAQGLRRWASGQMADLDHAVDERSSAFHLRTSALAYLDEFVEISGD